uniref:alpha/beta fold hydrolase n=1 Tax=Petrachloros mirabilis TaxID=2918835 RepID=UPI00308467B2
MKQHQKPKLLAPKPVRRSRPLFVFLPGMDGTGTLLHQQLDGLDTEFDVRCLAIPEDDLTGWDDLVAQVLTLIRQEQQLHPRPLYLCGESFGGCLALKLAGSAPQLFDRLILINAASSFARLPWLKWGSLLSSWLPTPLYQWSATGLVPFLIEPSRVRLTERHALLSAMQSVSPRSAAWRLSLLRDFDLQQIPLKRLHQPTLVIAGGCDKLLPSVEEARRLVKLLPSAHLRVLPASGHACLLEAETNLYRILDWEGFVPQAMLQRA